MLAEQHFIAYSLDAEMGFWRNISMVLPTNRVPKIVQRVNDTVSMLALVSANVGIAIIPETLNRIDFDQVVMRNIDGPKKFAVQMMVYRRDESSPAVLGFIKTIRNTRPTGHSDVRTGACRRLDRRREGRRPLRWLPFPARLPFG